MHTRIFLKQAWYLAVGYQAMKKISREKAALGIFIFLALAGLGVLITYIVTVGHSLNVAASNIDDATGNLDEYTAILYKGTANEHRETVINTADLGDSLSSRSLNKRSTQSAEENSTDEVSAADTTESSSESKNSDEAKPVSLFALQRSYIEKGACVFSLDTEHLTNYNTPTLIRAGNYTYGIFSLDEITAQKSYLQKRVADYEDKKADIIICLVSDVSLLDSYEGVDIVISAQDEGFDSYGVLVDGVFYNDAALQGQIGTILVSPSRTITARDAASL